MYAIETHNHVPITDVPDFWDRASRPMAIPETNTSPYETSKEMAGLTGRIADHWCHSVASIAPSSADLLVAVRKRIADKEADIAKDREEAEKIAKKSS